MHIEKHWVRTATLSEKRLCKIRITVLLIVFIPAILLVIWLINSENANHTYFSVLSCFLFYVGSMILDTFLVLSAEQVRINNQADFLTRDKWYHFFEPLSAEGFTLVPITILLLIGSIIFFLYALLTGNLV